MGPRLRTATFGIGALALLSVAITIGPLRQQVARANGPTSCVDADGDGFGSGCSAGPDCNDADGAMHPGAVEICGDGRDNDCSGAVDDAPGCVAPPVVHSRVPVPASTFLMGSERGNPDERPSHRVSLDSFAIDRYEVTNARYEACVTSGACTRPRITASRTRAHYFGSPDYADYPVAFVDWHQARAFCEFAGGRLPTEAEWERAARGLDGRTYPWGDDTPRCSLANFAGCLGDTDRVGRRIEGASPALAEDMAGNVWEWTEDVYDAGYYAHSAATNPRGPDRGPLRVARGGCFAAGADSLRTTCRKAELASAIAPNIGFRCVYGTEGAK